MINHAALLAQAVQDWLSGRVLGFIFVMGGMGFLFLAMFLFKRRAAERDAHGALVIVVGIIMALIFIFVGMGIGNE